MSWDPIAYYRVAGLVILASLVPLSYLDVRSREVPAPPVYAILATSCALTAVRFILVGLTPSGVVELAISILIGAGPAFVLERLQVMGEADFYLLLSISIALSSKDSYAAAMYGGASPPIPPAAVIIIYAALVVVAMHAARLARGLARNGWGPVGAMGFSKRLAALLAGYPAKLGDYLSSDFDFLITVPLETPSGIRYALKLSGRLDEERELRARVRDMTKRGLLAEDDVVWVSYGYPFILSLFMGLLLFMLFGAMPIAWMFHISA